MLAGPIVMIATYRWRSNHDVSGPRWRLLGGYLGGSTASIYDFKYRGCVRRPEKTWECLCRMYLALKMSDSSGDLVVSIVRVIFFMVGGNGSGE